MRSVLVPVGVFSLHADPQQIKSFQKKQKALKDGIRTRKISHVNTAHCKDRGGPIVYYVWLSNFDNN